MKGKKMFVAAVAACVLIGAPAAHAGDGKLLLTGGVSSIDGAAGGGIAPWALTGTYASSGQMGFSASASTLSTPGYGFKSQSVAAVFGDKLEISLGAQDLDTGSSLAPLGLNGLHLRLDVIGAKLRVAGDILDQDRWMPQISVGAMRKHLNSGAMSPTLTGALGAKESDMEYYASAAKLFLGESILANATLRATRANQNGLLGFGSASDMSYHLRPELSIAWLASRGVAIGAEYKFKNNNLSNSALGAGALAEDGWADAFVAWAPTKDFSLTAAWVDLGRIAPALRPSRQSGFYLSGQISF